MLNNRNNTQVVQSQSAAIATEDGAISDDGQAPQDAQIQADGAASQGDSSIDIPDGDPATPEDEAELQRAQGALSSALYKNEQMFNSVIDRLKHPDIPPINKLSDTTIFLVTQIDKKINIDEGVILPFVADVYGKVYEIATTSGAFSVGDSVLRKGLMVTIQLALHAYGVSDKDFNDYAESIGQDGAKKLINFYKEANQ